jgi:hypothetical protein
MLILCTSNEYAAARAKHPAQPILCTDRRTVHMPGHDKGIPVGAWRSQKAIASANSKAFQP